QRRAAPEMGFPEGPGAFGLRPRRRSLTDPPRVCSLAAPWLASKSLRQTGTGFMIRSTKDPGIILLEASAAAVNEDRLWGARVELFLGRLAPHIQVFHCKFVRISP